MQINRKYFRSKCRQALWATSALLAFAPVALADQSLRISGNTTATFTVPNRAPFNNLGSTRIEFRMHDWVLPVGNFSQVFDISESQDAVTAVSFFITNDGSLCAQSWADVMNSQGNRICTPLAGRSDILVRYTRDVENKHIWVETWNTAGGGYTVNIGPAGAVIDAVTLKSWAGTAVLGGRNLYLCRPWSQTGGSVRLGWLKWHAGKIGNGAAPPRSTDHASLGDWRFEGNGANQTPYNFALSLPSKAFETTPEFDPVAIPRTYGAPGWSNWLSLRAGYPGQLDGTSSFTDETRQMGYQWEFITGPSPLIFQDATAARPVILGHVFGTYKIRLMVTAPSGRQHKADLDIGAVAMDNNGIVIPADPSLSTMLGPQIAFGKSAWPYLDERHKSLSEFYGALLTTRYIPRWRNLLTGTVSVTKGGTEVTGVGTQLNTELDCQVNNNIGDLIAIRYADASVASGFRYRAAKLKSCTAAGAVLAYAWDGPSVTGVNFGKFTQADFGYWNGGSDGANYYDNVLAHYSMYYRSGNTAYRDFARELADRYIESPLNDYFGSNGSGGPFYAFAPRVRSLSGLMLRALDGRPEIWQYIYKNVWLNGNDTADGAGNGDIYQSGFAINPIGYTGNRDPREEAYQLAHMATGAMLYPLDLPNGGQIRSALLAAVNKALTGRWQPTLRPDGSQRNYYNSRLLGMATVTSGSPIVTGSGFTASICAAPARIWFVRSWLHADQDAVSYSCIVTSPTQIILDKSYQGTSGTKNYTAELINGPPTQPFMQGIVSTAMWLAWQATGSAFAKQHVLQTVDWIQKFGWRPLSKGLYYIRSAVDCEPNPEMQRYCVDTGDYFEPGTREYAAEVIAGFSWAYLIDPGNKELRDRGDRHAGGLYGAPGFGGPSTEDNFSGSALVVPNTRQGKYFGFYYGFGNNSSWPAARLGGLGPQVLVTTQVPYDLTDIPGAQAVRLTVLRPNGLKIATICRSSPCAATLDARQGTHWGQLEYLDSNDKTLDDFTSAPFFIGLP